MNRIYKKIFWYSFWLYFGSTMYTRIIDCDYSFPSNVLYALPLDAFPLKYMGGSMFILGQVGVLSAKEVIDLLKSNSDVFPHLHDGMTLDHIDIPIVDRDYFVLRLKNPDYSCWGDLKIYYSCFPYAISEFTFLPGDDRYYNLVLPYPQFLAQDIESSPKISVRWKNFDGK